VSIYITRCFAEILTPLCELWQLFQQRFQLLFSIIELGTWGCIMTMKQVTLQFEETLHSSSSFLHKRVVINSVRMPVNILGYDAM
jgi:hypothetical protein